jgi:hypothetical protein
MATGQEFLDSVTAVFVTALSNYTASWVRQGEFFDDRVGLDKNPFGPKAQRLIERLRGDRVFPDGSIDAEEALRQDAKSGGYLVGTEGYIHHPPDDFRRVTAYIGTGRPGGRGSTNQTANNSWERVPRLFGVEYTVRRIDLVAISYGIEAVVPKELYEDIQRDCFGIRNGNEQKVREVLLGGPDGTAYIVATKSREIVRFNPTPIWKDRLLFAGDDNAYREVTDVSLRFEDRTSDNRLQNKIDLAEGATLEEAAYTIARAYIPQNN